MIPNMSKITDNNKLKKNDWYFGERPNPKQLIYPRDHFLFDLGDISNIKPIDVFDEFYTRPMEADQPGMDILRMISDPAFIWMATRILTGYTLTPLQAAVYQEIYSRPFSLLIGSRGFAKSWGIALIFLLKAALTAPESHGGPGFKAVIVGSGFRQSKIVFEYIEKIWKQSSVLRSICNTSRGGDGPYREQDRFTMRINGNTITAIPIGDGTKIRGLRANAVACIDGDSLVETDKGLIRIKDFERFEGHLITGNSDLPLEEPREFIKTKPVDVYEIKMENGFVIRCSEWHRLMTRDGWEYGRLLKKGDYIESRNYYKFPDDYVESNGVILDEKLAWLLGIMVSKGRFIYSSIYIRDANEEERKKLVDEYGFTEFPAGIVYKGRIAERAYSLMKCDANLNRIIKDFGFEQIKYKERRVPWSILKSPRSVVEAYLPKLDLCKKFKHKSERLCRDIQVLSHKLGNTTKLKKTSNQEWQVELYDKNQTDFIRVVDVI